jgi:hypothetical protein
MFSYDDEITGRFPSIHAGVVLASGLINGSAPDQLIHEYATEQAAVYGRLQKTPIADLPPISAWRQVFAQFGVKPTQHRSAGEALLRRLSKSGSIPNINTLVDLGNLVSIRYGMPVAVVTGPESPVRSRCGLPMAMRLSPTLAPMKSPIRIRARSYSSIRRTLPALDGGVGARVPRAPQATPLSTRFLSSRATMRTLTTTSVWPSPISPPFSAYTSPEAN